MRKIGKPIKGDDNIAQHGWRRALLRRHRLARKGKDIRWPILLAIIAVQPADLAIVHKRQADLTRTDRRHICAQGGKDCPTNNGLNVRHGMAPTHIQNGDSDLKGGRRC